MISRDSCFPCWRTIRTPLRSWRVFPCLLPLASRTCAIWSPRARTWRDEDEWTPYWTRWDCCYQCWRFPAPFRTSKKLPWTPPRTCGRLPSWWMLEYKWSWTLWPFDSTWWPMDNFSSFCRYCQGCCRHNCTWGWFLLIWCTTWWLLLSCLGICRRLRGCSMRCSKKVEFLCISYSGR